MDKFYNGWLVVLGLNTTLTAMVISWRSVTHMCFLAFSHQYEHNFSFQSHRQLFSHASVEVRGENMPERKVASTGDETHNQQVMSPTRSPLSNPGGADTWTDRQADSSIHPKTLILLDIITQNICGKKNIKFAFCKQLLLPCCFQSHFSINDGS